MTVGTRAASTSWSCQEADARTDIFAFGAVLYEMLTGKKAFEGKSQASLIAAILDHDPSPICTWQPLAPPALDRVIGTCLAKDPDARWQNAGDLARELTWIGEGGAAKTGEAATTAIAPATGQMRLAWSAAGLIAGLLIGVAASTLLFPSWRSNRDEQSRDVARVLVGVSPADQLRAATDVFADLGQLSRTALALSPDGRTLVFSAVRGDRQLLYARALDQLEAVPLPGTDDAANPFFSPDGLWIGFWANGALKKVPLSGGAPTTLCESPAIFGGSWGSNDTIGRTMKSNVMRNQTPRLQSGDGSRPHGDIETLRFA